MTVIALAAQATVTDPLLIPLRSLLLCYARTPSPLIAGRIADCVETLLENRDFRIPADERCTYQHMRIYWRLVESLG